MKKYLKNLLCMLMVLSVVFTLFVPAFASYDTAAAIEMDKAYSESITSDDGEDYYKFTTTEYGRVRIYVSTAMRPFTVAIHNANKEVVKSWVTTRSTSGDVVFNQTLDAGTYYLKINGEGILGALAASKGDYTFRMVFNAENKAQPDTDADKNNELKYAKEIKVDSTSSGKILNAGEQDFYKLVLNTSGALTFKFTSKMEYYSVYLLNANGNSVWSKTSNQWDATKKQRSDTYNLELSAGTYYIKVNGIGTTGNLIKREIKTKGNYQFDLYFKSAGATSVEPNDSIVNPNKILFDKEVIGHLSITDGRDFYEVTAPAGGVMVAFVSYMPSYNIRVLDVDNKEVWSSKDNKLEEKATSRKDIHEFTLAAGKYFIVIDGGTGKYDFQISKEVNVAKVKTVKYERGVTTLKLKWSAVAGAAGYEVFRYDEAKKEFVKVGSTTSKRYLKLKKLKGGTTYDFKVRAYTKINDCIVYGDFSEEKSTTTTPAKAVISSVKAGKKSATVNWKSVNGASGYRVFYTTDKDFDYAKKVVVKDAKATSRTIKKLKTGKKYYFKVRAYKTFGGKNIYGSLSKIKSVKVK